MKKVEVKWNLSKMENLWIMENRDFYDQFHRMNTAFNLSMRTIPGRSRYWEVLLYSE